MDYFVEMRFGTSPDVNYSKFMIPILFICLDMYYLCFESISYVITFTYAYGWRKIVNFSTLLSTIHG